MKFKEIAKVGVLNREFYKTIDVNKYKDADQYYTHIESIVAE